MTQPQSPARGNDNGHRVDLKLIAEMITPGSRVLDVGCGDGELLDLLATLRQVDGRGVEISHEGVNKCVARGLAVIQGDANTILADYPPGAFDYVILSQAIQALHQPRQALEQLLRIGKRAVVSFPNFGHWRVRAFLAVMGRMPMTASLPDTWYDTPNIHFCTIRDFVELCSALDLTVERAVALDANGNEMALGKNLLLANLVGEQAVFVLSRGGGGGD
ncbi:MAG: methionine biosynthesis protein MetW [Alphaproteobacteria bacterium]